MGQAHLQCPNHPIDTNRPQAFLPDAESDPNRSRTGGLWLGNICRSPSRCAPGASGGEGIS